MSRIGKLPIAIPEGVDVKLNDGILVVKGKLGELSIPVSSHVQIELKDNNVIVNPVNTDNPSSMWATTRSLINGMIKGVSEGFEKTLIINGVGYKAQVQGRNIKLNLGFSHDIDYPLPEGVNAKTNSPTELVISGYDKQKVGQVAAEIRAYRKPEPYKGKGVRYSDEHIIRKEGKKK